MNIWILNHYAISPKSAGGTRHFDLAKELSQRGHRVRIFASSFNHFSRTETVRYEKGIHKEQAFENVNFTWIKTPPYNNSLQRVVNIGAFSLRLNKVLKQYLKFEHPDVIIGSSVHPLTPLVGLKKARRNDILFYFEERDLWPQTFIDFGVLSERNPIAKILFHLEKYLYSKSDRVIFLFEHASSYAVDKGLPYDKTIYLPNGFNSERKDHSITSDEIRSILQRYSHKKICLYIGSMGQANHMEPLIELAEKMQRNDNYHFLFIGDGPKKQDLMNMAHSKKLTNIEFIGSIPKKEIPYILKHAYIGLISIMDSPLYKWGFSMNKLYDYLSAGLPVVMLTNLKDIGEINNSGGIIHSSSIEEIREKLESGIELDRNAIKRFAEEHYSWNILSEKLLSPLESDLKRKETEQIMKGSKVYEKNI